MHKFFLWAATAGIACVYCDMAAAKTTFLPDWQNAGLDFKGDGESDLNGAKQPIQILYLSTMPQILCSGRDLRY